MMKKILIVDDEPEDLETMKTILEKEGYIVTTAADGIEALDLLIGNGFDLILLDIKMPALSGYALLRLLREKLNHNVKLGYVSIVPKKEVNLADCDGFIQKPFSPTLFLAEVKKILGRKRK
ncbi:MAG: response regulator [Candidatus Woesearchaeota archaeon]